MNISKTLLLSVTVLSLTACQTMSKPAPASQTLLANIEAPALADGKIAQMRSASSPVCATFYENTATYASLPLQPKANLGGVLMKTLVLGTLAGVSSGAVAAIGIESAFVEAAVIGTASQMTYNVGDTVYDKVVSGGADAAAAAANVNPMDEIATAAAKIGCPAPDVASIERLKTVADIVKK